MATTRQDKRIKTLIIAGLSLLLVATFGYQGLKSYLFSKPAPDADFPAPANETEARVQDLTYLEEFVRGYDRSYGTKDRIKALRLIEELKSRAGALSSAGFELGVSRVTAIADNAHTSVWNGPRAHRYRSLPLFGYWFDDGFHIIRIRNQFSEYLGARITRIGATPLQEVYEAFIPYYGGPVEGLKAYDLPTFLQNTDFLKELGFIENADEVPLTLEFKDGRVEQIILPADPVGRDEIHAWGWHRLSPTEIHGENGGWTRLFESDEEVPFYLRELRDPFRLTELPEVNGLYLQYRQNQNSEGHSIQDFQSRAGAAIRQLKPRVLIVDQRHNGGGNYTLSANFMADIPGLLPDGARIYIITGHETFSAGISSVAFLKAAARERGVPLVIIGRRIGDRETSWGETNTFMLPNSGIGMTAARGMHDREFGCRNVIKCYWSDFTYDAVSGRLDPDIYVPSTFSAYAAGRDPVLDKILEIEAGK